MPGVHSTVNKQDDGTIVLFFLLIISPYTYPIARGFEVSREQFFCHLSYMKIHLVGECMSVYIQGMGHA